MYSEGLEWQSFKLLSKLAKKILKGIAILKGTENTKDINQEH